MEVDPRVLQQKIRTYFDGIAGEHHRYRSWEHCYTYFRQTPRATTPADRDHAALQLGFYLASWGMYRGSSFLLQHAYTIHRGVIDVLGASRFDPLWKGEFGANADDLARVPLILEAMTAIREAYRPFAPAAEHRQASDALVTKIMLGTFGCLPAFDRYFVEGFRRAGLRYSWRDGIAITQLLHFCQTNLGTLREEQDRIERNSGVRYPLMKLVDMHFWQLGFEGA